MKKKYNLNDAKLIANAIKLNLNVVDLKDFKNGLNIELEHKNIIKDDLDTLVKIVVAHLKEDVEYYKKLVELEKKPKKIKNIFLKKKNI